MTQSGTILLLEFHTHAWLVPALVSQGAYFCCAAETGTAEIGGLRDYTST